MPVAAIAASLFLQRGLRRLSASGPEQKRERPALQRVSLRGLDFLARGIERRAPSFARQRELDRLVVRVQQQ